jgi:opacity protein-like surface antigen
MLKRYLLVGLAFVAGLTANAQVAPSATSFSTGKLAVGGEFSIFQIDAASHPIESGVGVYIDYDPLKFFGLEVEGRTIQFNETENLRRDQISGGFRYTYNRGKLAPYAKALAGIGSADFPRGSYGQDVERKHDTFTTMTFGGGVDYKLTRKIYIRGEYEYQYRLDYGTGRPTGPLGITNPNGYNVGVSYRIF